MRRGIRRAALALALGLALAGPVQAAEPRALVPVGRTVGLELETDGVYVVEFEEGPEGSPGRAAGLKEGDRILTVDGRALETAAELRELVDRGAGAPVVLGIDRGGRSMSFRVRPVLQTEHWRLGVYVRDRISGLGTLTFYDPESGLFGALGHGVGQSPGALLRLRGGLASETQVTEIQPGQAGTPGALRGQSSGGRPLGQVELNTERGLFGHCLPGTIAGEALPLAAREEVRTGPAEILCGLQGGEAERYGVEIEAVRLDRERCRDLRIVVTDPRLLAATGGIVQGMSGSPILQDGRLVGAVTHVLVQDPTRGYGILIGHMLEAAETAAAA